MHIIQRKNCDGTIPISSTSLSHCHRVCDILGQFIFINRKSCCCCQWSRRYPKGTSTSTKENKKGYRSQGKQELKTVTNIKQAVKLNPKITGILENIKLPECRESTQRRQLSALYILVIYPFIILLNCSEYRHQRRIGQDRKFISN